MKIVSILSWYKTRVYSHIFFGIIKFFESTGFCEFFSLISNWLVFIDDTVALKDVGDKSLLIVNKSAQICVIIDEILECDPDKPVKFLYECLSRKIRRFEALLNLLKRNIIFDGCLRKNGLL